MSYFDVDTGFFPVPVKACFSKKAFHKVLKDHAIPLSVSLDCAPLENGIAETHTFSGDHIMALIVVVYDLETIGKDVAALAGTIAHESVHVVERILEYVGEKVQDFGEESRAYLTQHLVEQMFQGACVEIMKSEKRKSNRKKTDTKSETGGGTVSEVGEPQHDGGSGPDSDTKENLSSGTKGSRRAAVRQTKSSTPDVFKMWSGRSHN